jgi:hypothetical protein
MLRKIQNKQLQEHITSECIVEIFTSIKLCFGSAKRTRLYGALLPPPPPVL